MPRSVLLLGGYLVVLGGVLLIRSAVVGLEDGVITEEQVDSQQLEVPAAPQNPVYDSSRCCRDPVFEDANYLFVSTMDGRLHALDANNDGEVAWVADFDTEALMCGTLGKMQPMQVDGRVFTLVPALDGNLYMYSRDEHLLEPIPLSTDILLQASVRVGHDAVAGGRTVTTTGVDPLTGEVRYHCSSSHCNSAVTKPVTTTLVFRRSTSKIRAVDALTGIERWNLSVSEYDATLVKSGKSQLYAAGGHRIRYLVQPPDGVITAYDNCGNELWSQQLDSHIVRTWRLENGELSEVSLFDADNIHTLSVGNEVTSNTVRRTESLFYLGTLNNEPFIMHSSLVKKEMKRIAKNMDLSEPPSSSQSHNQLARPSGSTYLIEQGTVDELLFSSYKRSFTAKQARNNNKQISTRQNRELQVVAANEGRVSYPSVSCPSSEGTALIGEKDIRSAAFDGPGGGDQGWFVMRPSGNPAKRDLFNLLDPSQCNSNIVERFSKTLRVDHMVSGWWRIIALAMLGLVGSASVVLHALLSRRRKRDALSPSLLSSTDSSIVVTLAKAKRAETRSTSVGPSVGSTPSSEETPTGEIRQRRTTSSHDSVGETFHSKFLQDFEPVKLLGHGGFGVVFEAINRLDECPYAVKRIAVSNSERAIQRVLREVRAMAKLDHPSIIRYYHTWIERPPDGWQELLSQKSLESSSSVVVPLSEVTSEPSQSVEAPAMNEYSDDGSWLDDGNDDGDEADREELSDSDDDESEISAPKQVTKEESESVIFATYSSGDASKANTKVDKELAQLGKKMVLVSSTDEDLMPSPVTSNFVYIYIQMQLCQEKTLHMWLSEHRLRTDRPLEKMKMWMIQMCSAVSYIHHQGLIHRDMKPQNIFFASDQTLKVGDLGLVTRCVPAEVQPIEKNSSRFAIHTDNVGTRGYMSPEQLANKPYTFKVDVFSLGLIYCELVIPFQTLMERSLTLSSLQHDSVPDSLAAIPEERDFIRWLTCMDPDKRPTCDEILDSDYLAGVESQMSLRSNGLRRRPKSEPKP
ncbi:unnamed protein product [Cylicocyclus nassatus]|uniref:PRKR-like endoplasmic reticulum kinase n=1 Tax=Cylicocyclus nassatus TaxID=53992 RepID=A0AA36HHE5_CYLNA|nr:unnamed protein product [Cylicocyclus nassatus]